MLVVGAGHPLLVEVTLVLARLKRGRLFLAKGIPLGEGARGGVKGDVGSLLGWVFMLE